MTSASLMHIWHTNNRSFSLVQSIPDTLSSPTCKDAHKQAYIKTNFFSFHCLDDWWLGDSLCHRSKWLPLHWTLLRSQSAFWGQWPGWLQWLKNGSAWTPHVQGLWGSCTRVEIRRGSMLKPRGDFPRLNDHCKEEPAVRGSRRTTVITPKVSSAGLNTFHILSLRGLLRIMLLILHK